jgi:hypothetical protein
MSATGSGRSAAMPGPPRFRYLSECLLRARISPSHAPAGYNDLRGSLWARVVGPRKAVPKLDEFDGVAEELAELIKDAAFADGSRTPSETEALGTAKRWLDVACAEAQRVLAP